MDNKVELIDYFGNDLMIVNAARVSFGKQKETLDEKDQKLIKYLVDHKHTSPFRHPQLQFRIKCPIFVERQLFKHQVGLTANSISGRYVDFMDEYWLPYEFRKQSTSSKQGSSDEVSEYSSSFAEQVEEHIYNSIALYNRMVDCGIAKEQARIVCPMALMTQFIWTGSLQAFLHMFSLRLKPDAQKETREIAQEMLDLVKNIPGEPFKYTIEAFGL